MPVTIHGKEYLTVAERLDMMNKKTKGNYGINTELLKFEGGCVIIKATLTIGEYVYTGIAMEEAGSSKIIETSFVECAETSAIGRALASASYHGSEFCSADELVTALNQQKPKAAKPKATMKVDSNLKVDIEAVKEKFGGTDIKHIVNFGKHNGKDWKDVPEDYINWVCKNSKVDWQRDEAQKELNRRSGVPDRPNRASGGMSEVAYEQENELDGMPL